MTDEHCPLVITIGPADKSVKSQSTQVTYASFVPLTVPRASKGADCEELEVRGYELKLLKQQYIYKGYTFDLSDVFGIDS